MIIKGLWNGTKRHERFVRLSSVGKKLTGAREFFYLRSDSGAPLTEAIGALSPNKLTIPELPSGPEQMELFY